MAYMKSYYWLNCSDLKTELTSSLKLKYHTLSTWVPSWLASKPIGRNPDLDMVSLLATTRNRTYEEKTSG